MVTSIANRLPRTRRVTDSRCLRSRRGVLVPLFAITLPALVLLCAVAINIAHFRMLRTELKIAADASAHAAGRAMSVYQDVDQTIAFAQLIGGMNQVGNAPFQLAPSQVVFGRSIRPNLTSRYNFTGYKIADVRNEVVSPNSVAINAAGNFPLLLTSIGRHSRLSLTEQSIATQVDRDVVLVLDKSGSMLDFRDDPALSVAIDGLYAAKVISKDERNNAKNSNSFSLNVANRLQGEMKEYAIDRRASSTKAARHSLWYQLRLGVTAFFDVVEGTDQVEKVAIVTFSSSATLNNVLSTNYAPLKTNVNAINPTGSTAIGSGMAAANPELFTSVRARPFATKTIVVLSDGANTTGANPVTVAKNLKAAHDVTIHTVSLSEGSDLSVMDQVAAIGGGTHFHSSDGSDLEAIFRTIANNLPTLLTK